MTLPTLLASVLIAWILLPMRVAAQQVDHSRMQMPMPAKDTDPANGPAVPEPMDHSQMEMPAEPQAMEEMDHSKMGHDKPAEDGAMQGMDHAGHSTQAKSETDHAGHSMQAKPADPGTMEGMDHSRTGAMGNMRPAPREPITPIPELTDADRAAAVPADHGHMIHADILQRFVLFNRLEVWDADPGTGMAWEGQAWFGTDLNRLWLRSEGERVDGKTEGADLEVLYGRSIARWWDVVAGVRHDFQPAGSQSFAAIGVMGLAPQKFEVGATAYIGERGQTAARVEAEYELLLTNRLVLQPLVEANLHGRDDRVRGIGSGLSTIEVGLRLRYEVVREFAPYIGIVRERAFGNTADFRRDEGEDIDDTRIVAGLRIWF